MLAWESEHRQCLWVGSHPRLWQEAEVSMGVCVWGSYGSDQILYLEVPDTTCVPTVLWAQAWLYPIPFHCLELP